MNRPRPSHIREVLDSSKLPLKARLLDYKIQSTWPLIVGDHLSKRSSPLKLIKCTLYVNVSSSAWMTEFQYQKAEIMERINREFQGESGGEPIKDIIFRPGSLIKTPLYKKKDRGGGGRGGKRPEPLRELTSARKGFIKKTVAPIKDKDLRELISRTMARSGD